VYQWPLLVRESVSTFLYRVEVTQLSERRAGFCSMILGYRKSVALKQSIS
jgi:hypothetical protein